MHKLEQALRSVPQDKLLHVLAGIVIYGAVATLLAPVHGFTAALFAGVLKEVYDECRYGGWDSVDLFATIVGAFIGVGITIFT